MNDMPFAAQVIALAVQQNISIPKARRMVRKAIKQTTAESDSREGEPQ